MKTDLLSFYLRWVSQPTVTLQLVLSLDCRTLFAIPEDFLSAYAVVKTRARDKKDQRKIQVKAEAVQDPAAAAQRKTKKHEQERDRKKRRVEDRRHDRGSVKKRRSHF